MPSRLSRKVDWMTRCVFCDNDAVCFCAPDWYCVEHHPKSTGTTLLADMLPKRKPKPAPKTVNLRKMEKRLRVVEQRMENRALIEAALKHTLAEVDRLRSMEERLVNLEREMGEANMGELVSGLNRLSMRLAKIERIIMERTRD